MLDFNFLLDLDPDLQPRVCTDDDVNGNGMWISHHLIHGFFTDAERANKLYREKKADLAEAVAKKNWEAYIWIHEKPYRVGALTRARRKGLVGKNYWKLVGAVWRDSENIHQNLRTWRRIWSAADLDRNAVMDKEDQEAFANLPDKLTIYRGTPYPRPPGMSWTLDREKAAWFANRFYLANGAYLLTGTIQKDDAKAVFLSDGESEVVALRVQVTEVQHLPPLPSSSGAG
jgi:hypothetical protein